MSGIKDAFVNKPELWFFVGFAIILLVIIIVLAWLLRRRRKAPAPAAAAPEPVVAAVKEPAGDGAVFPSVPELRHSFLNGMAIYRDYVAGSRNPYLVPWFAIIGPEDSGKTTLLDVLDSVRPPAKTLGSRSDRPIGCSWWFFQRAVVLDIGGEAIARADGSASGEMVWTTLLGLLRRYRPRRPLDGIILTLPVNQLTGPDALSSSQLTALANQLYARLWQTQKAFGFTLPVHVVITKCDLVPGFDAFTHMLPLHMRRQMLGWSNPHPLGTVFRPEWITEAFSALDDSLFQAQLELYGQARGYAADDDLFFPRAIQELVEPLRATLTTVFKRTAFQESLYFRGVYFAGDATADHATDAPNVAPVFVQDLFERKIFAEHDLARAIVRWAWGNTPWQTAGLITTAVVAVVGFSVLTLSAVRLSNFAGNALPALQNLAMQIRTLSDQSDVRAADGTVRPMVADPAMAQEAARNISRIDDEWPVLLSPQRLFSTLPKRTAAALSVGYYRLISGAMRDRLDRKGHDLANAPAPGDLPRDMAPEMARLRAALVQMVAFERAARLFEAINGTEELGGFDILYEYTLGAKPSPEFLNRVENYSFTVPPSNNDLEGASLDGDLSPFLLDSYHDAAAARIVSLADAYLARLSGGGEAMQRLAQVSDDLNAIVSGQRRDTLDATFASVNDGLHDSGTLLETQDTTWIGATSATLGSDMQEVLNAIAASKLLGTSVRDTILAHADAAFERLKIANQPINSVVGPLVARNNEHLSLSPVAQQLRSNLSGLLSRSFIREARGALSPSLTRGAPVLWDAQTLETAVGLAEDYLLFESKDAGAFPKALQAPVRGFARIRLGNAILATVARSQIPFTSESAIGRQEVENDLRVQIRSFRAASPLLLQLLHILDQLSLTQAHDILFDAVTRQAGDLLGRVDQLLEADRPYQPEGGDFHNWNGGKIDVASLFAQRTPVELDQYLDSLKTRIGVLAHDLADPLVEFLYKPEMRRSSRVNQATKWAAITLQLDRYENSKPSSSLTSLEKFITSGMDDMDENNCTAKLPNTARLPADDYFQLRLRDLAQHAQDRCRQLVDERILASYTAIARAFNERLAGAYPFVETTPSAVQPQVDLETLKDFFAIFDRDADSLVEALRARARYGVGDTRALQFMENMLKVRTFLRPLLSDSGEHALVLDVDFRANVAEEIGGNEIIEWRMEAGGGTTDNTQTARRLRWHYGDPVAIVLRWAKDGTMMPAVVEGYSNVVVDNYTVRYAYRSPWSLLTLLQRHGMTQMITPSGLHTSQVMGFTVLCRPNNTSVGALERRRVFIAVALKRIVTEEGKPTREERLSLPAFPIAAPMLDGTTPITASVWRSPVDLQRGIDQQVPAGGNP